jgi:hypothetical protein
MTGLVGLVSIGCPGVLPGSRPYKPVSDREAAVLARAAREVYPDDVRREPERHSKTFVVWVGILKEVRGVARERRGRTSGSTSSIAASTGSRTSEDSPAAPRVAAR